MIRNLKWLLNAGYIALRRPKVDRSKQTVLDEYTAGWDSYRRYLDQCQTLEQWLRIEGLEDQPSFCQVDGELTYQVSNSPEFNKQKILEKINQEFPNAKSVTEFGCGLGRNLLFLKKHMPEVEFYGYELCEPGVEIARKAAEKFGLDVKFSQLDYVAGSEDKYVFPNTDVAYTMYSLEQLPETNRLAVENILRHTNFGSIHMEPVPENYPFSIRGVIGRINHWKVDYLRNFDRNVSSLGLKEIKKEVYATAHNPLMFPTVYVLKK